MPARRHSPHLVPGTGCWAVKLLPVATLLGALVLAVSGSRMLMAGLYAYQTEVFASHWHKERQVPAPGEWQRINTAALSAVRLYPVQNAEYLQQLGENWLWCQYEHPMGSAAPAILDARNAAIKAFSAAATTRPVWPAHWSSLARAQASQLDFSPVFTASLRNAHQQGTNRLEVNQQIAELGLLTWPRLDGEARQIAEKAIHYSIRIRPSLLHTLAPLAQQAGNVDALCNSLHDLPLSGTTRQAHERLCPPLPSTL